MGGVWKVCKRCAGGAQEVCRKCTEGASLFVLVYHWLPLETIDLVGGDREFEV